MAFGYAATFTRVFDEAAAGALASFVFYFAIPIMLFRNMATTMLPAEIPWDYLLSFYLGAGAVFALGMLLTRVVIGGAFELQAIGGFGSAFGNSVLLGIPLVLASYGDEAGLPLFLLLAVHSTLLFTVVTIVIEIGRGSHAGLHELPGKIGRQLLTNPILWGLVCGVAYSAAGFELPLVLDRFTLLIAGAAAPCALFSVGASLRAYRIGGALAPALIMVGNKLLLHPLIVWTLASHVFQVPPLWTKVATLIAALPVGVNVYLFAARYRAGEAESAAAILLSSILSVVTVALVLLWLGNHNVP